MNKSQQSSRPGKNTRSPRPASPRGFSPLLWKGAGVEDWRALRETLAHLVVKLHSRC